MPPPRTPRERAIEQVRDRYRIGADEATDDQVAKLASTQRAALGLAIGDLTAVVGRETRATLDRLRRKR